MNTKIVAVAAALAVAAPGIAFAQNAGDAGISGVDRSGSPSEVVRPDQTNAPRFSTIDHQTTASVGQTRNLGAGYTNPVDEQAARDAWAHASNQ